MSLADALVAGAVGLCGSGVGVAVVQGVFNRGTVRAQKQAEDHRIWYEESHQNYATAKREVSEAKQECADCRKELAQTRNALYLLLEELEDQIIPMLIIPGTDPHQTRAATRAAIQRARRAISGIPAPRDQPDDK